MLYNMNISFSQIIDIKCILASKTKKQIARDLNISQMTLSREIKDSEILERLNKYFDNINPEINYTCDKLRGHEISNNVNEPQARYNNTLKADYDKVRLDLIRERKINDYLIDDLEEYKIEVKELKNQIDYYKLNKQTGS